MKPRQIALIAAEPWPAEPTFLGGPSVAGVVTFDDLFHRELVPMTRLAIGLVDSSERAEEIVQDAFEKTLLAWSRVREPGAYLRHAVVNGCRSELRRRRVTRRAPQFRADAITAPIDVSLLDALAALTPKRRIALTLRYYADLPEAEIADLMNVRVGTVKSLISRGLADLRKVVPK